MNHEFAKFESLFSLPLNSLSSELILTTLSHNLESIDISLLSKFYGPIDNLLISQCNKDNSHYQGEDFFIELAIICRDKAYAHPEWSLLSGRIRMLYIVRITPKNFTGSTQLMEHLLDNEYYDFCVKYGEELNSLIDSSNNWKFDIFSVETLMKGYLTSIRNILGVNCSAETPQYLYMRMAVFLWYSDVPNFDVIKQTYEDFSTGKISGPSPLQFNAGTKKPQVSSCFLIGIDDTTESIKKSWGDSATISANNGGLGMCFDSLRHSEIGNDGWSRGVVPWIKIENEVLATVDQCFHPDTIVYTIKDGPKRIADVGPGEKLIRSDGLVSKVLQPIVYDVKPDGKYFKLYIKHYTKPVIVSNCHPILSINNQSKGTSHSTILAKLKNKKVLVEYVSVEDLNENSFVGFPIPLYEKDMGRYSKDDCRMYGILLGDGSFTKGRNDATVYLGTKKTKTIEFVRNYLTSNGLNYWESVVNNTQSINWTRKHHLFPFTREMLYDKDDDKHFHSAFLHLPIDKLEQIFIGLLETDGCYKLDSGEISIELSSLQVIESLRYILLRMGVLTSGYCRDRVGNSHIIREKEVITTRKLTEVLRISKTKRICELLDKTDISPKINFFEYDGKLWTRMTKKELINTNDFSATVHDLEMETHPNIDEGITSNYLTCTGTAHNGGKRKGSGTMWICDWHIDIFEFIDLKDPVGKEEVRARDLFYGIMISDLFMYKVKHDLMWSLFCPAKTNDLQKKYGDAFEESYLKLEQMGLDGKFPNAFRQIKARELWLHILRSQKKNGMPFMKYKDAVNRKNNQSNLGTIRMSNLCVSGDTKILTKHGQLPIKFLMDKSVEIWNGQEWSNITVRKTATNVNLLRVTLSNGSVIDCTSEHKFYIQQKLAFDSTHKTIEVRASNLIIDQTLIDYSLPNSLDFNTQSSYEFKHSYTHGYFCCGIVGVGTVKNVKKILLSGKKTKLVQYINYIGRSDNFSCSGNNFIELLLPTDLLPKYTVPHQSPIDSKLRWLEGVCDAGGIINNNILLIDCGNYNFAQEIRLMLQTLGVKSSLTTNLINQISIKFDGLYSLSSLGFSPKLLKIPNNLHKHQTKNTVKVISIKEGPQNVDTYCFNEPIRHMGMFNGILTGNCVEIDEYVDKDNIASCNLSSIVVSKFVKFISCNGPSDTPYFDFDELGRVTRRTLRNLKQMIDRTYYPSDVPQIKYTNMRNRPIGVGIQGLADAFCLMDYCWDSAEASELNEKIARVMYYHAMDENILMALEYGEYETFRGSPASNGLFQFDLWDKEKFDKTKKSLELRGLKVVKKWEPVNPCKEFNWNLARSRMIQHGLYFSLVFAQMPTASSAHILGNNESVEPYTQLLFARTVLSGQFVVSVTHFVKDLEKIGLWNDKILRHLFDNQGSIQSYEDDTLSEPIQQRLTYLKKKYKTAFELSQKVLANLYFGRARYQCQSTSHNLFMKNPTTTALSAYHMGMFNGGAKTGMYYLRQTAGSEPLNFSLDSIHVTTRKSRDLDDTNVGGDGEIVCSSCHS